jgi:hypothetical protein
MEAMDQLPQIAWEPVTPRGVAAFARANAGRLWLVQFLVALVVAASVVWFLHDGCFPTIRSAILQLPAEGEIRSATLNWRGDSPQMLAEGRFLAFSVDLNHSGDLRSPAHVQVEFGRGGFRVRSLFGYMEGRYPDGWIISFNRTELQPRLGAWQPAVMAIAAVVVVVYLMVSWLVLALLYAGPVWLIAFYANRDLNLIASWKLSGAALLPGALVMAAAIVVYDFGALDLVHMIFILAGHLVLGWIYLWVGPLFLPRHLAEASRRRNPFATASRK